MEKRKEQQQEVNDNFKFFQENYISIIQENIGKKFILLKNKEVIGGFESWEDAKEAARIIFKDDSIYSIQEVDLPPAELGYQSYAIS